MSIYRCPWCDHLHIDAWDLDIEDGESREIECEECDRPIRVTLHVTYDYDTERGDDR
jgi:DNA-directed RNA polymerase subunit RPC12/RpoP